MELLYYLQDAQHMKKLKIEHLYMLVFAFFAALGHPVGRIIVREMHPILLGTMSLLIGLVVLVIYVMCTGRWKVLINVRPRDALMSAGIGVFGFFLFQILTFSALSRIPASVNAFLINTSVVYISLLAAAVLKERIPAGRIMAIALALVGMLLVVFNRGFRFESAVDLLGCLFSILGAVVFSIYSVFGKKLLERNDPVVVVTIAVAAGSLMLVVFAGLTVGYSSLPLVSGASWLLTVLIGVTMIGLAYPLWFVGLKRLPASQVSLYIYMAPLFAVLLSFIILQETFGVLFWVGALLILGGIVLASIPAKIFNQDS
jgi:drug/metabolite transporter (DMT)-like permease